MLIGISARRPMYHSAEIPVDVFNKLKYDDNGDNDDDILLKMTQLMR